MCIHVTGVMRHASDSWLMRHASHVTGVRLHVTAALFSDRRPLPVMTTTGTAAIYSCITALRFAPVELYGIW